MQGEVKIIIEAREETKEEGGRGGRSERKVEEEN